MPDTRDIHISATDLAVNPKPGKPIVGDGIDETTTWSFTGAFPLPAGARIVSAVLTLDIRPGNTGIGRDTLTVGPLRHFVSPVWSHLPIGKVCRIDIQLLERHSSDDLIRASANGTLAMTWQDDAVISHAELLLRILD